MNDGSDKKPQQVFNSKSFPLRVDLPRGRLASLKRDDIIILGCIDDEGNAIPLRTEGGMVSLRAISQKWEYKFVGIDAVTGTTDDAEVSFNEMGEKGWELIHVTSTSLGYLFKRPKAEAES